MPLILKLYGRDETPLENGVQVTQTGDFTEFFKPGRAMGESKTVVLQVRTKDVEYVRDSTQQLPPDQGPVIA